MSLKGKNLEGIGNNGIETNTQESQEVGGARSAVVALVLSALLLSGGCNSSKGTNTLDVKVPKGEDNPSSQKTTGQEQARQALEEKGIVIPKSGESKQAPKQDPNELVINLSGDKGLGNIGEVNQEKEGNPLGLVVNGGAFGTNRRTGGEFSIGNENFLGKTEISDESKAVSGTLGGKTEGGYYGKVTGVARQEKVNGDYGKADIHQYAVGAETGKKVFDNGTDEVRVGLYGAFVTTESKTMGGSEREIIGGGQRTTISSEERFKGGNLGTVGGVVSYVNEQIRAQLSAGPTFGDRGPGLGVEGLLEYDLTEYLSLYAKGSSILGRQGYIEGGMGINVTDNVKVTAGLYHGEGHQPEDGVRIGFEYKFGGAEKTKWEVRKTRVITPVAMMDLPYKQIIGQIKKEQEVSIENIMVPINLNYDANGLIKTLSLDLSTLYPTIGSNLEIVSYNINKEWPGNLVLNGTPTISGKTLNADSIGGGHVGPFSLEIKDKDTNQTYKLLVNNYGI